jgi:hypothetical protein
LSSRRTRSLRRAAGLLTGEHLRKLSRRIRLTEVQKISNSRHLRHSIDRPTVIGMMPVG